MSNDKLRIQNDNRFSGNTVVNNTFVDGISVSSDVEHALNCLDYSLSDCIIFPGFCDVHVHLREPGFSYKETIKSGTMSAARGGYTAICSMPNLSPVPDSIPNLDTQLKIIHKDAIIPVFPYGALTVKEQGKEAADIEGLSNFVIAFSDDGHGVQSEEMMLELMLRASKVGKLVVAHCEDNSLLNGGYIHKGRYAYHNGHKGISSESEWKQLERDLKLVKKTKCAYHVCHISTKESVELIRAAKAEGLDVTCETAPHYLVLTENDLINDGRYKMNPPLRSEDDRTALIEGLVDGTIDMIATDHAPHSHDEKNKGLKDSLFGVVGLETAFPILYTELVMSGVLNNHRIAELLSINPRKRFNITTDPGYCIWDVKNKYKINPNDFYSMGRSTPFDNKSVFGKNIMTVFNNAIVYRSN